MQKFTAKFFEKLPNPGRGQKIYRDEMPPFAAVPGLLGLKVGRNRKYSSYSKDCKAKENR